jgi:hypothetical protein
VLKAVPQIRTLSDRLELIDSVGHRENAGSKLVDPSVATKLYAGLADELLRSSAEDLARERDLAQLLLWFLLQEQPDEATDLIVRSAAVLAFFTRLLRSSLTYILSGSSIGATSTRTPQLPWDDFVNCFGLNTLGQLLKDTRETVGRPAEDPFEEAALDAAERYLTGELPLSNSELRGGADRPKSSN